MVDLQQNQISFNIEETEQKKKTIGKLTSFKFDDMILKKKFISKKNQISNQQSRGVSFQHQIVKGIRNFFSPSNQKIENAFIQSFKTPNNKNIQNIQIDPYLTKKKINQHLLYLNLDEKLPPSEFISKLSPRRKLHLRRKMKSVFHILTFMSMFKSIKTIRQVKLKQIRQKQIQGLFPLKPTNLFKQIWNFSLIFMLILTAILTPIRVCFVDDQYVDNWYGLDLLFDIYFWMDMLINFLSCHYDENNQLVCTFKEIFIYYIFGWFSIDFVALFPFDKVLEGDQQFQKLFRLLRLPRLYKIVKIIKLSKGSSNSLVNQLLEILQMNVGLQKILNMIAIMLCTSHLVACLYYFSARLSDFAEDTWVVRLNLQDKSYFMKYITALYWSFQTLTSVGYGDIGSVTLMERIISIIYMSFGVGFYSMTLSDITSLIQGIDVEEALLVNIINDFEEITQYCEIPLQIQLQVTSFFEQNCKKNELWGMNTIAYRKQLGYQMYEELAILMRHELVGTINIFLVDAKFTANLFMYLQYYKVQKDELIYREGDPRDEIFFLLKGQMVYLNREGQEVLQICQGDLVGEIEVIKNQKRQYNAATTVDTTLLICKTQIFMIFYEQYTTVQNFIKKQIKNKIKQIRKAEKLLKEQKLLEEFTPQLRRNKSRKFNNQVSISYKNQIKRIQNFSCLYLAKQQQEIINQRYIQIIKNSKEHFQLFSDSLKFKRQFKLKSDRSQYPQHAERQNQELKDKTITSINAPGLRTNNTSMIFPMNSSSSNIHGQSDNDLLESVRLQEQQISSALVNKAQSFKTNLNSLKIIKPQSDKIIQQYIGKNLSISKNLPQLIEQDEYEENRQTEINNSIEDEEKDHTEIKSQELGQIDQQSIRKEKITRIQNKVIDIRNNGQEMNKEIGLTFKNIKEVHELIKFIQEIQINHK